MSKLSGRSSEKPWSAKRDAYLAAFLVPLLIMVIIFIQRGIFPFGKECYLRTDMYHQYAPFFSEFQYKLTNGGSLLYSWDVGLGVNFSAIYAYYLASPLNWLVALCPKSLVIEFMTVMIVVKTALCAVTMTWYLLRRSRMPHFYAAFFGIFYAMSGYMCAYSWNIMWIDCIILFPLVVYGSEELVDNGRFMMYIITLGLSILTNYYISIMTCIFLVFWFFARAVLKGLLDPVDFFGRALMFALSSLLAGGLAMAVLRPEIYALQQTASGTFSFPHTVTQYFSIIDMLARHMGNIDTEVGLNHWPNIYCGVAVYQMMLLYFANRRIPVKEKAVYTVLLIFFLAGFSLNVLNYIWHGLHYPNSLPCRQSYIYIFLVLYMCYRTADEREGNTLKDLKISFFLSFAFILLCQKTVEQDHIKFWAYYLAMLFISLYALLLYLKRAGKIGRNTLMFLLLGLVAVEAAVNTTITSVPTTSRVEYLRDNAEVAALKNSVPTQPFARFEKVKRKTKDDGAWMNFPSVSLFSSMANRHLSDFMRDIGCEASVNAYSITGSTPLADALLDVRYAFWSEEAEDPALTLIAQSGETWLYENPHTFPLAFTVSPDLDENWVYTLENPADVQNDLCSVMRCDPVLIRLDGSPSGSYYNFTAPEDGIYYGFATGSKVDKVKAELPGGSKTYENLKRRYFMEFGMLRRDDTVSLTETSDDAPTLDMKVYRFDYDALARLKEALASNAMEITRFTDTEIDGTVTADSPCLLFTSIPYDKGWQVTVDGVPAETHDFAEAFLSVKLTPGTHTLAFRFTPEGRTLGFLLTLVSLILTAGAGVWTILAGRRRKQEQDAREASGAGVFDGESEDEEDGEEEDTEEDSGLPEPADDADEEEADISEPADDAGGEVTGGTEAADAAGGTQDHGAAAEPQTQADIPKARTDARGSDMTEGEEV